MLTQFLRTLAIVAVIMGIVGAIFAIAPASSAGNGPPQGRGGNPGQGAPQGRGPGGPPSGFNNILASSGSVLIHFVMVSVVAAVVVVIERGIRSRKRNQIDDAAEAEFANE